MVTEYIILNERFEIRSTRNLVRDRKTSTDHKLEARLMNLLCLLMEKTGQLVTRETITKEIWDDYGNADEGLTQAISYLRRVFSDDQKKMIETVPKKGYILNAKLEHAQDKKKDPTTVSKKLRKSWGWPAIVIGAIILVGSGVAIYISQNKTEQINPNSDLPYKTEGSNKNESADQNSTPNNLGADVFIADSTKNSSSDSSRR